MGAAPVCGNAERVPAIEVVAVDYHERFVDHVLCHQNCVGCAPRLLPFRVEFESFRNLVEFLGDEYKLERAAVNAFHLAVFLLYRLAELLEEILSDNIDHFAEARLDCVINRVVDDSLPGRAESVHLFEAAVTAAHTGRKDQKCRFHIIAN